MVMHHHIRRQMTTCRPRTSILVAGLASCLSGVAFGQSVGVVPAATPPAARNAVLDRTITLRVRHVSLQQALTILAERAGLHVVYDVKQVPVDRPVSVEADAITIRDALSVLLEGTGLIVSVSRSGWLLLKPDIGDVTRASAPILRQGSATIAGRVIDAKTDQPVAAATITVVGTPLGAATRFDGTYRITGISTGSYRVTARRLGYAVITRPVTIADTGTTTIEFALVPSAALLDQVVTTVTGNEARYRVGNLIETLPADSVVRTQPVTDLGDLINARVPGVEVFSNGGMTGASPTINIRGQNSFTVSNQPLLYVDGVRAENGGATSAYGNIATYNGFATFSGRLNDLVPSEVESIEIVKGPSAATLYGTEAANGVILVTTKRGSVGGPRWDVTAEAGALDVASQDRLPYSYYAWGHTTGSTHTVEQCPLLLRASGACVIDSVTRFSPLRDPATTIVSTGSRQRYIAQVSGGAGQARYFVSGSYENEVAPVKLPARDQAILDTIVGVAGVGPDNIRPNAATKGSARLNVTTALGSAADIGLSSSFISRDVRIPAYNPWLYGQAGPGYRTQSDGWAFGSRPAQYWGQRNGESVAHFTGSAAPAWHPTNWLTTRATTGVDYSSNYVTEFSPPNVLYQGFPGYALNGRVDIALYTVDLGVTASANILPGFSSKTSVGAQYAHRSEFDNSAAASGLPPGTTTVSAGAVPSVTGATIGAIVAGGYAEQTVGLNDRLFLTGAARVDGSSAFGQQFGTTLYPKASASWLVTDEPWAPRVPGLASVRLRAAYGASGVEPGATDALATVTFAPAVVDGGTTTGATFGAPGNPQLRPERQTEFEAGVDVAALARRLHIELTYYRKRSTDALVNVPVPTQLGLGTEEINVGSVRNVGYELGATAQVLETPALAWSVAANTSTNQNRLLKLAPGLSSLGVVGFGSSPLLPGYPLNAVFAYPILRYGDANGDGVIEPNEVTVGSKLAYVGSGFPTSQLTVQSTVALLRRALQVSVQVDARTGMVLTDYTATFRAYFDNLRAQNDPRASLRDQAAAVALVSAGSYAGFDPNGSFTRLREVAVTYELPLSMRHLLRAQSASVTLAGRNLALWTRYTGADPEVDSHPQRGPQIGAAGAYYDFGAPPPSQYWIARVRVGL